MQLRQTKPKCLERVSRPRQQLLAGSSMACTEIVVKLDPPTDVFDEYV